jgi:hypothetical protein
MLRNFHSALVHYQGGAPDRLKNLRSHLDIYVAMLREHTRKEETLLSEIRYALPNNEWHAIAQSLLDRRGPAFRQSAAARI